MPVRKRLVHVIAPVATIALACLVSLVATADASAKIKFTYKPKSPRAGQLVTFKAKGCSAKPCRYQWADRPPGTKSSWRLHTHKRWLKRKTFKFAFDGSGRKYIALRTRNAHGKVSRWTYRNGKHQRKHAKAIRVRKRAAGGGGGGVGGGVGGTGTVPGVPAAPYAACNSVVSSTSAAASSLASAGAGQTICLANGTYGKLTVSTARGANAILRAQNPGGAHLTGASLSGRNFTIAGFDFTGEVALQAGANGIRVSHNHIHGGSYGVAFVSTDSTVPNAPPGSSKLSPIANALIDGNKIHDVSTDALYINNWRNVRLSGNEIYGIEENGSHNDCLQSVFGGSGMTFDHNYEHDNNCQGFFIKDGDASNVTLAQNLFVRNRSLGEAENTVQVYNTVNFVFSHNTDWSQNGWIVRGSNSSRTPTATVTYNYIYAPTISNESGPGYQVTQAYNTIHAPRNSAAVWPSGPGFNALASPAWVNAATDDYRVAGSDRGINWRPADMHFGP